MNFPGLEKFPELKSAISTVSDGNMSFLWGKKPEVLTNREQFLAQNILNFNNCVTTRSHDSTKVITVNKKDNGKGMADVETAIKADGIITKERDLALFMVAADCSLTVFYDPTKKVLALVHINFKNPPIIEETIKKFSEEFSSNVSDLIVSIGPSIQKKSFMFVNPVQKSWPDWQNYVEDRPDGKTEIDMMGFIKDRILSNGIKTENLFVSEVDTYSSPNLFSHRRAVEKNEIEGRFGAVIGFK